MTGAGVLADLACAIADGAEVISDFRVLSDQKELFGPVASVPAQRGGPWNPRPPRPPGCCHTRNLESRSVTRLSAPPGW
jgi:hypothetical protein